MASNVVPLFKKPKKRQNRWYKDQEDGKWYYNFWTLDELQGKRPRGHPRLDFGPRGGVLIAPRQVWVEIGSDELWVIEKISRRRDGKKLVYLKHYLTRNEDPRRLTEATLRGAMLIYDEAILPIQPGPRQKLTERRVKPTSAIVLPFPIPRAD
jgi:hypothetical protein